MSCLCLDRMCSNKLKLQQGIDVEGKKIIYLKVKINVEIGDIGRQYWRFLKAG